MTPPTAAPQIPDTGWMIRGAADVDGDGQSDLIWEHETTQQLVVWLMNGLTLQAWCFMNPPSVDAGWKIVAPK